MGGDDPTIIQGNIYTMCGDDPTVIQGNIYTMGVDDPTIIPGNIYTMGSGDPAKSMLELRKPLGSNSSFLYKIPHLV